jgi:4-hydroxy-2-oxoheptanedioate aldolase
MQPSSVRKKLNQGELAISAKCAYVDPELVELVGHFGFDGIWICLEHKRIDPAAIYAMVAACRLSGADAILRVPPANYGDLIWLLEAGVRGVMIPRVRHVDEARKIVEMVKFPPVGRRGFDGVHAEADFGRLAMPEYAAEANRESFIIIQIEEPEAVAHIDAIAALPGVDVLFVGPADLTLGLGKFGQLEDPEVAGIIRQVAAACKKHGKVAGIPCLASQVAKYRELGFRFLNVVSDYRCMQIGLKQAMAELETQGVRLTAR